MRRLAWAAGAFSAAIFAAKYFLPDLWLLLLAGLLVLAGTGLLLLRRRWLRAAVIVCFLWLLLRPYKEATTLSKDVRIS